MCKCLRWLFRKKATESVVESIIETVEPVEPAEENLGRPQLRKALITGINTYPNAPLRGCVNDALLMYKVLSEKYDFKTENIDLLTDKDCTKANILNHLKKLTMNVQPGDYIFFHYSGHGSQVMVKDRTNTDESDGMDEILCPVDLDWDDPLRDHELGAFFKAVPAGVKILIVLDCCHSGTGLRNSWKTIGDKSENDWVNRFMPPPPSNILSDPRVSLDDALNFVVPTAVDRGGFMVATAKQGDAILISGCQENQTSADAYLQGRYQGALTCLLVQTLAESNYNITYRELIVKINRKTDSMGFQQNPQLEAKEGLFDKAFLR